MKYFIDFEATQFSNEIISVGCVREDGETFYSLVNVQRNKITPFITDLTGISKNDVEIAPSSDEVFENLYNWLSQDKSKAQFFCYGNNDIGFIRRNLNKTNSIKAQMALSLIAFNLIDYSKAVIRHFGLIKSIALVKVLAYYRQEEKIEQNHNALEDALFLKEIYEKIDEEEDIVDCPFPGYEKPVFISNSISAPCSAKEQGLKINRKLSITVDKFMNEEMEFDVLQTSSKKGGTIIKRFVGKNAALNYIISSMSADTQAVAQPRNIASRLIRASTRNEQYCGRWWKIVARGDYEE
jgi:inhibitor of KinA sporulation pathway (predicted exonuclease)